VATLARSILIYANCQGEELQQTGCAMPSLAGRLGFKWIPLHLVTGDDWSRRYGQDFMADVAVLWEQVETGPPSEHREELHRRLPGDCQIVRFPPFSALCLWPFAGNDPRLADDPARYPWSDSVAASLATEDLPDEALFQRYLAISTERMPDLERRLRLDIARWRASDAASDIRLTAWVEQRFRRIKLFHTAGHVTAAAITFLMRQLLQRTALIPRASLVTLHDEIDMLLRHHEGQDFESVPLHPLVAERLGLQFHDPNALYRWHGHQWSFREYILRYIHWAPYLG